MTEIRCVKCNRLLFFANFNEKIEIEIKCSKCHFINKFRLLTKQEKIKEQIEEFKIFREMVAKELF